MMLVCSITGLVQTMTFILKQEDLKFTYRWMRDFHVPAVRNPLYKKESSEKALLLALVTGQVIKISFGILVIGICIVVPIVKVISTREIFSMMPMNYRIIWLESNFLGNVVFTTLHQIFEWVIGYAFVTGPCLLAVSFLIHISIRIDDINDAITNYTYSEDAATHEEWIHMVAMVTSDVSE